MRAPLTEQPVFDRLRLNASLRCLPCSTQDIVDAGMPIAALGCEGFDQFQVEADRDGLLLAPFGQNAPDHIRREDILEETRSRVVLLVPLGDVQFVRFASRRSAAPANAIG